MLGRGTGHGELGVLWVSNCVVEVVLVVAGGDGRHRLGVVGEGSVLGPEGKGGAQGKAGGLVPAEPGQAGVTTKARVNITPVTTTPGRCLEKQIYYKIIKYNKQKFKIGLKTKALPSVGCPTSPLWLESDLSVNAFKQTPERSTCQCNACFTC